MSSWVKGETDLCVVESQPAVDGESLEGFLVIASERSRQLVDHLHHADDAAKHMVLSIIIFINTVTKLSSSSSSIILFIVVSSEC